MQKRAKEGGEKSRKESLVFAPLFRISPMVVLSEFLVVPTLFRIINLSLLMSPLYMKVQILFPFINGVGV